MKSKVLEGAQLKLVSILLALVLGFSCIGVTGFSNDAYANDVSYEVVTTDETTSDIPDGDDAFGTAEDVGDAADINFDEYVSYDEAVLQVRELLCNRCIDPYEIKFYCDHEFNYSDFRDDVYEHTGNPVEGDYLEGALYLGLLTTRTQIDYVYENGLYYYDISFSAPQYYGFSDDERSSDPYAPEDAAAVEAWATEKCEEIIASLNLDGKNTWQRTKKIYNWVCQNIAYDYDTLDNDPDDDLVHTAYDALINGCAVCDGITMLTYRLLLMADVDCRVVSGAYGTPSDSAGHAWMIIGMDDGYYYLCDPTADLGANKYYSFLRGNNDFNARLHAVGNEYTFANRFITDEWKAQYPTPDYRYYDVSEREFIPLEDATVYNIEPWYFYDGSTPINMEPVVVIYGKILDEGTDYDIEILNNNFDTVTINLIGNGEHDCYNKKGISYTGIITINVELMNSFSDIGDTVTDENNWYFDAVYGLKSKNIFTGYENGDFGVGDTITRADLVTTLWRYLEPEAYAAYDESAAVNTSSLPDIADGTYYTEAVNWAVEIGIVTGKQLADGSYMFDPYGVATFEEAVTILARMAVGFDGAENYDTSILDDRRFSDEDDVDVWAQGSMAWAIWQGIVTGNVNENDITLAPLENVARERFATVLWRSIENETF